MDGVAYDKTVEHYLMVSTGGSISRHDGEFDAVRLMSLDEGLQRLRYANERDIVRRAGRLIEERDRR